MKKVQIITDSCSDLTPELMELYGIDYAPMSTVFEGKNSPALLSWTPEEVHAFYGIMRDGKRNIWIWAVISSTSPAPPSSPAR